MTEVGVKNFQSVASVNLAIDGFTVVIGKNNIGKSAIVRAINAALTNQVGDDFIRRGEKCTDVSIVRKDIDIKWQKGDSASYVINKDDKHPYTKLNRAVPKPILEAGFRNIEVGDDLKINPLYASQFEPVFLINRPGPQVTEILSEVYDINVVSRADDLCQKEIRSTRALLKTRTSDQQALESDLEKFKGFDKIKGEMAEIQKIETSCTGLNTEIIELGRMSESLDDLKRSVFRLRGVTKISIPDPSANATILSECQWVSSKLSELSKVSAKVKTLGQASKLEIPDGKGHDEEIQTVEYLKKSNESLRALAITVRKLKATTLCMNGFLPAPLTETIERSQSDLSWIQERHKNLTELAASVRGIKGTLASTDESLTKALKEKSEYSICPACGGPLNQSENK